MKYNTRIVPQSNGYVGYALLNNEPVFTTNVCNTPQQASSAIEAFISSKTNNETTLRTNLAPSVFYPTQVSRAQGNSAPAASRGCCGRG